MSSHSDYYGGLRCWDPNVVATAARDSPSSTNDLDDRRSEEGRATSRRSVDAAFEWCQRQRQRPKTLDEPLLDNKRDDRAGDRCRGGAPPISSSPSPEPATTIPSKDSNRSETTEPQQQEERKDAPSSSSSSSSPPLRRQRPGVVVVHGRRGDPRMHLALSARLERPTMPLLDALLRGGFVFSGLGEPGASDRTCRDEDGALLYQRKNQLNRRIRLANRKRNKTSDGKKSNTKGEEKEADEATEGTKSEINVGQSENETQSPNEVLSLPPMTLPPPPTATIDDPKEERPPQPAQQPVIRTASLRRDEGPLLGDDLLESDFDPPPPPPPHSSRRQGRRHSAASLLDDIFLALPEELDAADMIWDEQEREERRTLAALDPDEIFGGSVAGSASGSSSATSSGVSLWSGHFHAVVPI